jgi:hypothetical protein
MTIEKEELAAIVRVKRLVKVDHSMASKFPTVP